MTELESLLRDATERVHRIVQGIGEAERRRVVGVGAAGDSTLIVDRMAEDELVRQILTVGDMRVLSEERGELGSRNARLVAVLDPVDGSSNYERGIPFYCTSVAIASGSTLGAVECGIVRNLVNGDVYFAKKGRGATKNGAKISTSRTRRLSEAVVTVDMCRASEKEIVRLAPLVAAVKRQVHMGANALELCFLAEGRVDAFVDVRGRMRITDFAAAYLIAKEAGAIVTDGEGNGIDPPISLGERFGFMASCNSQIHRQLLKYTRRRASR